MGNIKDLTGQVFGKLKAIRFAFIKDNKAYWECLCECGKITNVCGIYLSSDNNKSCGCGLLINKADMTGKVFGRLTVISQAPPNSIEDKKSGGYSNCICECGKTIIVRNTYLRKGGTRSYGCLASEVRGDNIRNSPRCQQQYDPIISIARNVWNKYSKEISFDDFYRLSQQNCKYCNMQPSNFVKDNKNNTFIFNGLDRINSNKQHTIDNVVPCCKICNFAKRTQSLKSFINHINMIINNNRPLIEEYREQSKNTSLDIFYDVRLYSLRASIHRAFTHYATKYSDGDLTIEQFYQLSQMNCYYCGSELLNHRNEAANHSKSMKRSKYAIDTGNFVFNGLDRIDSNQKHNWNNVVPCCKNCNWAKNDLSLYDFLLWIEKLRTNYNILLEWIKEISKTVDINEEYIKPIKTVSENSKKTSYNNLGENNPMYGKKHSPETIKKISEANQISMIGRVSNKRKLTQNQADEIRELYDLFRAAKWTNKRIGELYNVSSFCIADIINNISYVNIP
jgi:hypothetical protein